MRVLHLEDNSADAWLVRDVIERSGFDVCLTQTQDEADFLVALQSQSFDLILTDNGLSGFNAEAAINLVRSYCPATPIMVLSGASTERQVVAALEAGASDYLSKDNLWQLLAVLKRIQTNSGSPAPAPVLFDNRNRSIGQLASHIKRIRRASDNLELVENLRAAVADLMAADGAVVSLPEHPCCDQPCIANESFTDHRIAVVADAASSPRTPSRICTGASVRSFVRVPVPEEPEGKIAAYWFDFHCPTAFEIQILEALAEATAIALDTGRLRGNADRDLQQRNLDLQCANRELEAFSYSVSHDLRSPLRLIHAHLDRLESSVHAANDGAKHSIEEIRSVTQSMNELIDDLLRLSQFRDAELKSEPVNLSELVRGLASRLRLSTPERRVCIRIQDGLQHEGDSGLLKILFENLLMNAWKYTSKTEVAVIEVGAIEYNGIPAFFVRDNGAGFDMRYAGRLFAPFYRLHQGDEFKGYGIGLATVQRIVHRHGGQIWAQAEPGLGATFYLTLSGLPRPRQ